MPFILASGSPRRHELLKQVVPQFTIEVSDIEEHLNTELKTLAAQVEDMARQKAAVIAERYRGQEDVWVLGADTMVCLGDEALGKPQDADDAHRMLSNLSQATHEVITGMALIQCGDPLKTHLAYAISEVTMRTISDAEIVDYVVSGEPMDKAGAYGIQGKAGEFITQITGEYENIVGLPLKALQGLLKSARYPA
jgi:septum formation protein